MNIIKMVKRLVCKHEFEHGINPLVGVHLRCEKCGHIIHLEEYIYKTRK